MHFGAIWSSFGPGLDSLTIEQSGWTKLKSREARKGYKSNERSSNTKRIRKEQEIRNIIPPYPIQSYLILIFCYLNYSCKEDLISH